jgi:hypothetical protein
MAGPPPPEIDKTRQPGHFEWQCGGRQTMADQVADEGKPKRPQQVYSLIVEVGRKEGDGLPPRATGAALLCYASGVDEAEAVRETVAILKEADMSPLEVQGLGTLEERLKASEEIDDEERFLMERALKENSVIVAEVTPFFD